MQALRNDRVRACIQFIFLTTLCVLAQRALAQAAGTGIEFWLAPPDVTDMNGAPSGGEPISLVLHASDLSATVTIDQPANGSFTPIVTTILANQWTRKDLTAFKNALESRPTNTVLNTGIRISSSAPITAYYEIGTPTNTAMLALKGADALGREFAIPLQKSSLFFNESSYSAPHQAIASFDIVATQNGTAVSIYSPVPLDGHQAQQQFSLTLNRGQAYTAAFTGANWFQPFSHPSGAVVLADKPVAVSLKDDSVHNPSGACTNLLGDQLVPSGAVGTDYIAIKGLLGGGAHESVVLVAVENDTRISQDGAATPLVTLFAGENFRVDLDYLAAGPNNATYLHASRPLYAAHISGFGCSMAMAQLPRLQIAGSHTVDLVREDTQAFDLLLISPADAVNGFSISGAAATIAPAAFLPVPGTGGAWMAARIAFGTAEIPASTPFRVSNSAGFFAVGVLSGGSTTGARYGYFSRYAGNVGLTLTAFATPAAVPEPGGTVNTDVQVTNAGDTDAQLTALSDSFLGSLDARGTCVLPQSLVSGASYNCSFPRNATGNVGEIQTDIIAVAGTSYGAAVSAQGQASVAFTDVIFADGFE